MRLLRGIFLLSLFLFNLLPAVLALTIPERPDGYVSDYARLLSSETKGKLEQQLKDYETKTSNQIVVAIFQALEGESLEDFSIRLAEKWKPGQKDRNNGIIFLVFKDDRKMRIETGYGLEGALPDALAGQIIQQVIAPYFKQGQYDEGVLAGVDAIIRATEGEFKAQEKPEGINDLEVFFRIVFMILSVLFFADIVRYGYYAFGRRLYDRRYNFLEWFFLFSLLLFLLKLIFRALFETTLSSRGGYYGNRSGYGGFSGGSSSGGFSGGGGRFGGGGASGGW